MHATHAGLGRRRPVNNGQDERRRMVVPDGPRNGENRSDARLSRYGQLTVCVSCCRVLNSI